MHQNAFGAFGHAGVERLPERWVGEVHVRGANDIVFATRANTIGDEFEHLIRRGADTAVVDQDERGLHCCGFPKCLRYSVGPSRDAVHMPYGAR